ncbi:MAG: prolyl oligopeptidase family serine peptidase [Flavisolibacter sp.]
MKKLLFCLLLAGAAMQLHAQSAIANAPHEILYGRKDGMALTMTDNMPASPNGKAIIWVVSGSWYSSYGQRPGPEKLKILLDRGYRVFEVMHGSQPRYNIEEALADLQRAVRYVRHHAEEYGIDPNKIGISGASAGGHLSLLIGLMDGKGNAQAKDPIDRESAKVQAVAVFYPPTDFANWGGFKDLVLQKQALQQFGVLNAFNFRDWDAKKNMYVSVSNADSVRMRAAGISPVTYVSPDDPPVFMYHGTADKTVPLQQSQEMLEKLKAAGIHAELKIKENADHGWRGQWDELGLFADWFDEYLK